MEAALKISSCYINQLPTELLVLIFVLVGTNNYRDGWWRDVMRLTQVCSQWRDIMLSACSPWTTIHLNKEDTPSHVARVFAEQSQNYRLTLLWPWHDSNCDDPDSVYGDLEHHFVARYLTQTRYLQGHIVAKADKSDLPEWLLEGDASALETLTFGIVSPNYHHNDAFPQTIPHDRLVLDRIFAGGMPKKLTVLRLAGFRLPYAEDNYKNLTKLSLFVGTVRRSEQDEGNLLDVLRGSPKLKELKLVYHGAMVSDKPRIEKDEGDDDDDRDEEDKNNIEDTQDKKDKTDKKDKEDKYVESRFHQPDDWNPKVDPMPSLPVPLIHRIQLPHLCKLRLMLPIPFLALIMGSVALPKTMDRVRLVACTSSSITTAHFPVKAADLLGPDYLPAMYLSKLKTRTMHDLHLNDRSGPPRHLFQMSGTGTLQTQNMPLHEQEYRVRIAVFYRSETNAGKLTAAINKGVSNPQPSGLDAN